MQVARNGWRVGMAVFVLLALGGGVAVAQAPGTNDLGKQLESLRAEGRYAEAVTVLKRLIAATEAQSGLDNPMGAALLNNLGELHYKLGLYAEAIPYYERALSIADKTIKVDNPLTAVTKRNLAIVYQLQGRLGEVERLYTSSIAQLEKFMPATRIQLASTLNNLAIFYQDQGRLKDAEPILLRVLKTYQDGLPPGHPYISTALNNLGQLYEKAGNDAKAELMLSAALFNIRKTLPADHPQLAQMLQNLGLLYARKQEWAKAVEHLRQTLDIYQKQTQRGAQSREGELSGLASGSLAQQRAAVGAFVNSAMKLLTVDRSRGVELVAQVLRAAQLTPSVASASLTQMSVRRMKGDGPLAQLVRERQDLVAEWQTRDKRVFDRLVSNAAASQGELAADKARLKEIDRRIVVIDRDLAKNFPEYAVLTNPQPLDVTQVQALLRDDEALVAFIETSSPSWVWVITKTEKNLSLVNLGSEALADQVAALRCGLDTADWADPAGWPAATALDARRKSEQQKRFERCRSLYPGAEQSAVLPFDLKRAHNLYRALFNGVEGTIAGKQLLIVPSQSLTQLPFSTLVAEPPAKDVPQDPADYRRVKWLGIRQSVTVLPSIASLAALRRNARPTRASKPWIGFGNPLLDGAPGNAEHVRRAAEARAKQACGNPKQVRLALRKTRATIDDVLQGTLADVAVLRRQIPLPETADELCDVAARLGIADADVWLASRASEHAIKTLSRQNGLDDYATLHFATHGLVAGNLKGVAEPALMLTPPVEASEEDDGLLTASEVAQLKLDANWIVLSACNTAAGGAEGAEALSGLARAFFYAGARSVLVSHWEVDSDAAVALTTRAFAAMQKDPRIGRAEALRRSELELMSDQSKPLGGHPSVWAPFVLVGEGGS